MSDIVFNVLSVLVVGEVSVHLHLHEEDSEGGGAQLDDPGNNPEECGDDEDAVPEPQQGKHLNRNYDMIIFILVCPHII